MLNVAHLKTEHYWTTPCKLQIGYSRGKIADDQESAEPKKSRKSRISESHSQLPTFEEISARINDIVPDNDHFGGYLREVDFAADRRNFLETFESELKSRGERVCVLYRKNRPVLNKSGDGEPKYVFDYTIHYIVYKSEDNKEISE